MVHFISLSYLVTLFFNCGTQLIEKGFRASSRDLELAPHQSHFLALRSEVCSLISSSPFKNR